MTQDRSIRSTALTDGVRAFAPLLIAVIPFGLVFGIVAAGSEVGPWLGGATSFIIFAGAAQLATLQLIDAGAAGAVVIATALVINARHLMYSAALAPAFREFPKAARFVLPYLLTDQAFAISIVRFGEVEDPVYRRWFFTGAGLSLWVPWQIFTIVGHRSRGSDTRLVVPRFRHPPDVRDPAHSDDQGPTGTHRRHRRRDGRRRCSGCALRPWPHHRRRQRGCRRCHRAPGDAMSNVGIIFAIGIGTYLLRLSFIGIVGDRAMPDWALVPLRFVAPAVLAALDRPRGAPQRRCARPGTRLKPESDCRTGRAAARMEDQERRRS